MNTINKNNNNTKKNYNNSYPNYKLTLKTSKLKRRELLPELKTSRDLFKKLMILERTLPNKRRT
jgi:hypothetical protein